MIVTAANQMPAICKMAGNPVIIHNPIAKKIIPPVAKLMKSGLDKSIDCSIDPNIMIKIPITATEIPAILHHFIFFPFVC